MKYFRKNNNPNLFKKLIFLNNKLKAKMNKFKRCKMIIRFKLRKKIFKLISKRNRLKVQLWNWRMIKIVLFNKYLFKNI